MADLTSRDALASRPSVPKMVLSTGSPTSLTPAPIISSAADPSLGPQTRFAVRGNAVITGGAGTLGLRSARALLEHGLSGLLILDVQPSAAEAEVAALRTAFPNATILTRAVDVTDEQAVAAAMQHAVDALGSITALFCFVGVVGCVDTLAMPVAQWRRILDINTTGAFICAQAAARHMVAAASPGCSITLVASISAHRVNYPQPQAAYNVSKAALLSLKSCLAAEWARYGIRTNSISPGYMDTVLNEGDAIAEHRRVWAERNPTGRMGSPSELTGVVVLLASDAGSYINGADFVVDGGGIVF